MAAARGSRAHAHPADRGVARVHLHALSRQFAVSSRWRRRRRPGPAPEMQSLYFLGDRVPRPSAQAEATLPGDGVDLRVCRMTGIDGQLCSSPSAASGGSLRAVTTSSGTVDLELGVALPGAAVTPSLGRERWWVRRWRCGRATRSRPIVGRAVTPLRASISRSLPITSSLNEEDHRSTRGQVTVDVDREEHAPVRRQRRHDPARRARWLIRSEPRFEADRRGGRGQAGSRARVAHRRRRRSRSRRPRGLDRARRPVGVGRRRRLVVADLGAVVGTAGDDHPRRAARTPPSTIPTDADPSPTSAARTRHATSPDRARRGCRTLRAMRVGVQMIFQSWGYDDGVTDAEVVADEVRLGVLADELGFDALWPVEHHFDDYSFCPDNTVFLAHMAARTQRILLGTGAVILPWNDPLRVAEKIALLDHLADGRVLFGMGRGLARVEYAGFGISMDESRDRFDESAPHDPRRARDRVHRGRRAVLPAAAHRDPARAGAHVPRPHLLRGDVARLGRRRRRPRRAHGDVQPAAVGRPGRVGRDLPRALRRRARRASRACRSCATSCTATPTPAGPRTWRTATSPATSPA